MLIDSAIACRHCGESPADSPAIIAGRTLDGQWFCRTCLNEQGIPDDVSEEELLREEVRFGFLASLGRGLIGGIMITTMLAALIAALFAGLSVAALLGGMIPKLNANPLALPLAVGAFFAFAWCFVGIVGMPMMLIPSLIFRHRLIYISEGKICRKAGLLTMSGPLIGSLWREKTMAADSVGAYWPLRRYVQITLESRKEFIVCGFTPERRLLWTALLSLYRVEVQSVPTYAKWWPLALTNIAGSSLTGMAIGYPFTVGTGNPAWTTAAIFIGMLDGLVYSLGRLQHFCTVPQKPIEFVTSPLHGILLFVLLGAKCGVLAGMSGFAAGSITNGVIGWFVIRDLIARNKRAEMDAVSEVVTESPV